MMTTSLDVALVVRRGSIFLVDVVHIVVCCVGCRKAFVVVVVGGVVDVVVVEIYTRELHM
jgi:hypothetical protein